MIGMFNCFEKERKMFGENGMQLSYFGFERVIC